MWCPGAECEISTRVTPLLCQNSALKDAKQESHDSFIQKANFIFLDYNILTFGAEMTFIITSVVKSSYFG